MEDREIKKGLVKKGDNPFNGILKAFLIGLFLFIVIMVVFGVSIGSYLYHSDFDLDDDTVLEYGIIKGKNKILHNINNLNIVELEKFEVLSEKVGKDNSNLYFIRKDFRVPGESYSKSYTLEEMDIGNLSIDVASFNIVNGTLDILLKTQYFKDKNNVYFFYEKDDYLSKKSYYKLIKIENASVDSWVIINDSSYSKDNKNIYYEEMTTNVDFDSFEYLGFEFVRDENNVYYRGLIWNETEFDSFKAIDYSIYLIDGEIFIKEDYSFDSLIKVDVDSPSKFVKLGNQFDNKKIFEKYDFGILDTLYEDDMNYYTFDRFDKEFNKFPKEKS